MLAFGLEPDLLGEFLNSMVMDLTISRYTAWEDLRGYVRPAAALGEAFQLTNFIRDISEDQMASPGVV